MILVRAWGIRLLDALSSRDVSCGASWPKVHHRDCLRSRGFCNSLEATHKQGDVLLAVLADACHATDAPQ